MHRKYMHLFPAPATIHLLLVLLLTSLCALCAPLMPAHAAGTPPTITAIANQLIQMGTSTAALTFSVSDKVTAPASLSVTCASSNTALIPISGIVVLGPDTLGVCSVTLTPKSVYSGFSTMTLTVKNGVGLTAKTSFLLTVNHPPTITKISNQTIFAGTPTTAVPFTVGDDFTAVGALSLSGASSNPTLIPVANVVFGGTGASRTVTVTPAFGTTGISTITLTVTDGSGGATATSLIFTVKITPPPTITSIPNQLINIASSTSALAFTVGDTYSPASSLLLTCTSSNTVLVHASAIVLNGPDAQGHCSVTLTPVNVYSGISTITLAVKNASGLTKKTTFVLTVNAKPTISKIANQAIIQSTSTGALACTIGDDLTAPSELTLTGSSSNTTLLPITSITFGGSDASRTVTVTPVSGNTGMTTITLTVQDAAGLTATASFTVTVKVMTVIHGRNSTDGAALVWVPSGSFIMGCPSSIDKGFASKGQTQQVMLSGYWIYEDEVTVAQYLAFCTATGYALPPYAGPVYSWVGTDWTDSSLQQMPIVDVTWNDCKAYADWAGGAITH